MINVVCLARPQSTGHLPRAPLRLTRVAVTPRRAWAPPFPIDGDGLATLAASRQKIPARCGKLDTHAVP